MSRPGSSTAGSSDETIEIDSKSDSGVMVDEVNEALSAVSAVDSVEGRELVPVIMRHRIVGGQFPRLMKSSSAGEVHVMQA